jgi:hypothetical protein
MACLSCGSKRQAEFSAEMLIHFGGLKNLDKPGVWVFPKLLVCLDCGFLQSTIPVPELASLAAGTLEKERILGRPVVDPMQCKSCGSVNQEKFRTEMAIHFPELKNIDKPVVWVFPDLAVCLDCGKAESAVPEAELRLLAKDDAAAAGQPGIEP